MLFSGQKNMQHQICIPWINAGLPIKYKYSNFQQQRIKEKAKKFKINKRSTENSIPHVLVLSQLHLILHPHAPLINDKVKTKFSEKMEQGKKKFSTKYAPDM